MLKLVLFDNISMLFYVVQMSNISHNGIRNTPN